MNETTKISDMDLMRKMMKFMRRSRMSMGGHGMPGMGAPGMGMRGMGMPPFERNHGPMNGCGPEGRPPMPPFERHHGPHRRRPPLSREHLLVMIGKHPEGIRQKDISDKIGINQSSTSELIGKLESDGYIVRKVDPSDKRATLLFLTELGQARAAEVEDERNEMFEGIFANLSEEEKQTLSDLLDKLLAE